MFQLLGNIKLDRTNLHSVILSLRFLKFERGVQVMIVFGTLIFCLDKTFSRSLFYS